MTRFIIALSGLLLSIQTHAQPAVILGPGLEPLPITVEQISSEFVGALDAEGKSTKLPLDQVLRLSFRASELIEVHRSSVTLTLRDGQVLVGRLVASNDEEAVRLKLDDDRAVQVPLDEMMSLVVEAGAASPLADEDDALLLATGEVLLGFVETFSEDAVGFVVGDADDAIQIPLKRVKALSVANKPKQAQAKPGTLRVTTADGSVVLLSDVTRRPSKNGHELVGESTLPIVSIQEADQGDSTAISSRLAISQGQIVTIEPVSERYQLTGLSDHAWQVLDGGEVFGVAMSPRLTDQGAIRLHAPVTLGFDLPKGVSRLAFTVAMDLGDAIPEGRRAMAGCELVVYDGDKQIARHALSPDAPAKRINVPLNSSDLRLVLEPGINGPVLDRVVITRAELLVSE